MPLFLSISEAADELGMADTTLYGLLRSGQLHGVKRGRRTLLAAPEVRDFAASEAERAGVPQSSVEALRAGSVDVLRDLEPAS